MDRVIMQYSGVVFRVPTFIRAVSGGPYNHAGDEGALFGRSSAACRARGLARRDRD